MREGGHVAPDPDERSSTYAVVAPPSLVVESLAHGTERCSTLKRLAAAAGSFSSNDICPEIDLVAPQDRVRTDETGSHA
jgi:hypothetical protein